MHFKLRGSSIRSSLDFIYTIAVNPTVAASVDTAQFLFTLQLPMHRVCSFAFQVTQQFQPHSILLLSVFVPSLLLAVSLHSFR